MWATCLGNAANGLSNFNAVKYPLCCCRQKSTCAIYLAVYAFKDDANLPNQQQYSQGEISCRFPSTLDDSEFFHLRYIHHSIKFV